MFRVPSIHLAAEMLAAMNPAGGAKRPRRLVQKEFFGKCVDGASERILADSLSLIGRLFEIYFVRLIGTPNQQFHIRIKCELRLTKIVVQESLGS